MFPKNSHLVFARHGNTDKHTNDRERRLTDKGKAQASKLDKKLCRRFDLVLCSSAPRAKETLNCLVSCRFDRVIYSDLLYELPSPKKMEQLIDTLASTRAATIAEYKKHENGTVLEDISKSAGTFVSEALAKETGPKEILILSHSFFLQMIIVHLFPVLAKIIETMDILECGAVEITTSENGDFLEMRHPVISHECTRTVLVKN